MELDDVKLCGASSVGSTEPVVSCLMEEKLIKKVTCNSDSVYSDIESDSDKNVNKSGCYKVF